MKGVSLMEMQMSAETMTHIKEHISTWPASKQDIVSACSMMSDITEDERKWVMENLPDRMYNTPDEAMDALKKAKSMM
jgi:hypothetical protein